MYTVSGVGMGVKFCVNLRLQTPGNALIKLQYSYMYIPVYIYVHVCARGWYKWQDGWFIYAWLNIIQVPFIKGIGSQCCIVRGVISWEHT